MFEVMIKGIPVQFPFEPYDLQKDYMSKMIDCLQNEQNGVLESPTGTGKTLSILCSSLAWLQVKKAQMQADFQRKAYNFSAEEDAQFSGYLNKLDEAGGHNQNINRGAFVQWPQIIYSSRTHSQLSQAMNELKRTSYNYMKACVLGSREQMCVHPEVKSLETNTMKVQMCRIKVQSRSCFYNNRVEREKDNPVFNENPVIDIEDLVKFGNSKKFCPYYMSKELKQHADIVFMPYNYLLDPRARKAVGVELSNSVIILDEAHNVEKICEDSASLQIKSTDITLCIEETTEVMKVIEDENQEVVFRDTPPDFSAEELMMLKGMLLKFEAALDAVELTKPIEGTTFDGRYIFELFEKAGITDGNQAFVLNLIERITLFLATVNEGPFQRKGHGLQLFQDLILIVFANSNEEFKNKLQKCYKVHIIVEGDANKPKKSNWLSKATASKSECRVLSYWCFSPGFGMNMLMGQGVKCIILTSGTLAPLKPLITELELKVDVKLENPHIVKGDQVCVKILSNGPDGIQLNSSYQNRTNPAYIKSLGMTISNLTRMIPGGLLIFFPSYPIMKMCQERWQESGQWASIYEHKAIFIEPRQKEAFAEAMSGYYESINGPKKGAIFMGVCRGKVSEGLDFIDDNGRAVIITGLPYPPLKDPRIILKKRYLDVCRSHNRDYLGGDDWYSLEATKAVNQAVGRVIRHRNDYGAIILLDSRFNNPRILTQMSSWLRGHVKHVNNYREIVKELKGFYNNAQTNFPVKERTHQSPQKLVIPSASFSSTSGYRTTENDVKIHKRTGDKMESQFKRTKFTFKSNIGDSKAAHEIPDQPSVDDIKEYLTLMQRNLESRDYKTFMAMIKSYSTKTRLADVFSAVEAIFSNQPQLCYLLMGLRNFIRPTHREEYDAFMKKYSP